MKANKEILLHIDIIARSRGIPIGVVFDNIDDSLLQVSRKHLADREIVFAKIDRETGEFNVRYRDESGSDVPVSEALFSRIIVQELILVLKKKMDHLESLRALEWGKDGSSLGR
jgi:hypothetical protein